MFIGAFERLIVESKPIEVKHTLAEIEKIMGCKVYMPKWCENDQTDKKL